MTHTRVALLIARGDAPSQETVMQPIASCFGPYMCCPVLANALINTPSSSPKMYFSFIPVPVYCFRTDCVTALDRRCMPCSTLTSPACVQASSAARE